MAARHTATRLGRTRGWGQCPVGPCMLEKSRGQGEKEVQEWHPLQGGGGWEEAGELVRHSFWDVGFGGTLSSLMGSWQHRNFSPGSAMCWQQTAKLQAMGSSSRVPGFKSS